MTEQIIAPSVSLVNGRPATTSQKIAEHFGKPHDRVLKDIRNLCGNCPELFSAVNFDGAEYTDEQGKPRPMYTVYFDGFMLLVMGYTGKKALGMKLAYIGAFNAMREKLEGKKAAPSPISKRTDPERKQLTAIINTWVGMAPIHYAAARTQVNAHFGVTSVNELTVAQVKEAIGWVQAKIDALPPVAQKELPPATEIEKDKFEAYIEQVEAFRARTDAEIRRLLGEGLNLVDVYKFGPKGMSGFTSIILNWLYSVAVLPSPLIAPWQDMDRAIEYSPLYLIREMEKILPDRRAR